MDNSILLEEYLEKYSEEAMRWYEDKDMRNIIQKVINQIKQYNRVCDEEDYWSEAFLALQIGVIKYNKFRKYSVGFSENFLEEDDEEVYEYLSRNPTMKFQTFAYWYLQKRLYKLADMGDVEFIVSVNGTDNIISAEEYYKNRHKYNGNARSVQRVYSFTELEVENDRGKECFEPVSYEDFINIKRNCRG
ncbi:MAG: hypothetical protein QXV73_05090 [Candidatus Micrarchaeia archaeon]